MGTNDKIYIDHDVALVLFEFLARFDETESLTIEDDAEKAALWDLHCALEESLVEPFSSDYQALLDRARARVRRRSGGRSGSA